MVLTLGIIKEATVLLLDELLGNLDVKTRIHMRSELRGLQRRVGISTIYVTHDQEEAFSLSDRVAVVMKDSQFVEVDHPKAIYKLPKARFTAEFVGHAICCQEGLFLGWRVP